MKYHPQKYSPKIQFDHENLRIIVQINLTFMVKEKVKPIEHQETQSQDPSQLILYNDEVNSFDYVIETLVDVCLHDPIQAEQCTWIAHYKGKCPVKEGIHTELKPIHDEMSNRGLTVSIDK